MARVGGTATTSTVGRRPSLWRRSSLPPSRRCTSADCLASVFSSSTPFLLSLPFCACFEDSAERTRMIGPQLQAASNTLDVLVESGDWKRDEKLRQATLQLRSALDAAGQSPEL